MVRATWRTFIAYLRRPLILALLILPLAFAGLVYGGLVARANAEYAENQRYLERLPRLLEQGSITAEGLDVSRKNAEERRLSLARSQTALEPPHSVQIVAQALACPGSLFALLLGVAAMNSLVWARRTGQGAKTHLGVSGLVMAHLAAALLVWGVVSLVFVPLALVAGLAALSFLPQASLGPGASLAQILMSFPGVWLIGASWSLLGASLTVIARSWMVAIAVGVLLWAGEFVVAVLVPGVAPWLPTFGAIGLVSRGASRVYNGSLYAIGNNNFPSEASQVAAASVLLVVLALVVAAWGVWRSLRASLASE